MSDRDKSRTKQYEKRRRNNKFITYFAMIATVLIVILIGTWIFGGGESEVTQNPEPQTEQEEGFFLETEEEDENENNEDETNEDTNNEVNDSEGTEDNDGTTDEEVNEDEQSESENEARDVEYQDVIVEYEESDDDNVIEAYTGNWPPIGTEQTGPHTTVYTDGSQDRIEIRKAVSYVTGIPEDEVIDLWIGNGGDQKVIATVTDSSQAEIFRVYLSWIDEEGWQPTRFEVLHENDA